MLSIMDPVELEGLVLFRDDEDPSKFHLLPDQPTIPVDENGVPDFYFIKYLRDVDTVAEGKDPGGGYIQLRTVLTITPERRARVVSALRAQLVEEKANGKKPLGLSIGSTEPILSDPIWTAGTVKLETFKIGDDDLVRKATTTVPVDLAGALGASVNLELDAEGAEIFWSSFKHFAEQQIPILVSYELTYRARVSADMTIHAERSTVIKQVWKHAVPRPFRFVRRVGRWVGIPFPGAFLPESLMLLRRDFPGAEPMVDPSKIVASIHSAVTEGAITVRINTDQAGGQSDAQKVQELLFKTASDVLSGQIIPAIFEGGGAPVPASESEDDASATTKLVKVPLDTEDTTTAAFDIKLTSTSTIERACNPNGPIHVLLGSRAAMNSCFKELRLSDGFFSLMRVTIATAGISFERDGIDAIQVFLEYDQIDEASPERPRVKRWPKDGCVLRSAADTVHWKFDMARAANGAHKREYRYRTDVHYGDLVISTDWSTRSDESLLINPAAMGTVRVEITLTAPKDQVKSARVALRYTKSSGEVISDAFDFTPEAPKKTWFKATGEVPEAGGASRPQPYEHQVVYQLGASQIEMPWTTSTSETLELPGPFVKVLSFVLRPQGSFEGLASLSGDVTYDDPAHGYRVTKGYVLDKLSASFQLDVPVMAGGPQEVSYTARVSRTDGSGYALAPGHGPAGTLWVGEGVTDFLSVQILPDLLDFDKDVQLAVIQIKYRATAGGDETRTFTFSKASKAAQTLKIPLASPEAPRAYDMHARYVAYDRSKSSEVQQNGLEDTVLVLDRQTP